MFFFRSPLLLIAIVFGIAVAVAVAFVRPAVGDLQSARRAQIIAQERLGHEQQIIEAYAVLETAVKANAESVNRLNVTLPVRREKPSGVPDLLAMLQYAAEVSAGGVFLQQIAVDEVEVAEASETSDTASAAEPVIASYVITLDGIASYESLNRFFSALVKSQRLFEPISFTFTPNADGSLISFNLRLRTFAYIP